MKNIQLNFKEFPLLLILLVILIVHGHPLAGQDLIIDKTGHVNPWSHLEINNDPDNFQFAIVTDRTGGHRPGVFENAVGKLNLLQPEFIMSVGDLIEGYTRDREEIYREWDEFNGFISELEMPFFYVPGNHDYINDVMADIWEEKYGRSYYHFVYRDVLFLALNSEEATKGSNLGGIEKPQYEYIKKVLKAYPDVRWTLLFMHQPLWILDNTRYWPEVEDLLKKRRHTVFAGHHHHYVKYTRNNGKYVMLATTGGTSQLRGPDFGEFDHVVWVTMTDEGPVLANLLLEGIWDENVVNEDISRIMGSDPLTLEPLVLQEDIFREGVQEIKIVNDENVPMDFTLRIAPPEGIITDTLLTGTVPPNNVGVYSIALKTPQGINKNDLRPVKMTGEFSYHVFENRNLNLKQNYFFAPVRIHRIDKTDMQYDIDGELAEWETEEYTVNNAPILSGDANSWTGPADLSLEFTIARDDAYVYFAIKVNDNDTFLDPDESVWSQDGIRLYLDARPMRISMAGREESMGKNYLGIFLSPDASGKGHNILYQPELLPDGVKAASEVDEEEGVLSYEFAVPVSWFNEMQGKEWQNFRLNIAVNDADNDGSLKRLWWQPEWRSQENIMGSGMMAR